MDIKSITLEEKVGQLIAAGFPDTDIDEYVIFSAYEYTPISIESIMKLLDGSIEGRGTCPVALDI